MKVSRAGSGRLDTPRALCLLPGVVTTTICGASGRAFSLCARSRRLLAVDHFAGVLLDAALAERFVAAIAKHRMRVAARRILTFGTGQRSSVAFFFEFAGGVVEGPADRNIAFPGGRHSEEIVPPARCGWKAKQEAKLRVEMLCHVLITPILA
jgi:hypothetical protein